MPIPFIGNNDLAILTTMNQSFLTPKKLLIISAIAIGILIVGLILLLSAARDLQTTVAPTPTPTQPALPQPSTQAPFKVVSSNPQDGQTNVPAAEILMIINTDVPIASRDSFSLIASPLLSFPITFTNTYPTKILQAQIIGGLQPNTTYTFTLNNKQGYKVYQWSFTTGSLSGQSQSGARVYLDQQIDATYYPLNSYLPYTTPDFTIKEYSGHLTLRVLVHNADLTKVKSEVNTWISSKGIDPASHTINFVTN